MNTLGRNMGNIHKSARRKYLPKNVQKKSRLTSNNKKIKPNQAMCNNGIYAVIFKIVLSARGIT